MLDRADEELVQIVDAAMAEARRLSNGWLACRPGCTHCCIGPFEITGLDAWRLRRGFRTLSRDRAARLLHRAAEASAAMRPDPHASHANLPCPVLDLETGRCELYHHRPIACRLHGPAVTVENVKLNPCRLNYQGAPAETIEACRVTVDPGPAREAAAAFDAGTTYVAFAFDELLVSA